jgi:hypothetical protein
MYILCKGQELTLKLDSNFQNTSGENFGCGHKTTGPLPVRQAERGGDLEGRGRGLGTLTPVYAVKAGYYC